MGVFLPADDAAETAQPIRAERSTAVVNLDVLGIMDAAQ
jgi:hypothetical protein